MGSTWTINCLRMPATIAQSVSSPPPTPFFQDPSSPLSMPHAYTRGVAIQDTLKSRVVFKRQFGNSMHASMG
jgi:hypothetical protein